MRSTEPDERGTVVDMATGEAVAEAGRLVTEPPAAAPAGFYAEEPLSRPTWESGAPWVPVTSGAGRPPCPECKGRGARVLPGSCAETECDPCEGTGEIRD